MAEKTIGELDPYGGAPADDDLVPVELADGSATRRVSVAQLRTGVTVIAEDVAFTPAAGIAATDVQAALEELAGDISGATYTDEEARDAVATALTEGEAIDIAVNDGANTITISAEDASTTNKGVSELATDAEAIAKSDTGRTLTPSNLAALGASDTFAGLAEAATIAETNTGTDTGRFVTPDGLAGSAFGVDPVAIQVLAAATAVTTGDGKFYFPIPVELNGRNLVSVGASVFAKSTSGTPTIQIARGRQSNSTTAHSFSDMLSTRITIDANEFDSKDAAAAAVIDSSTDDVATGDLIRIDIDTAGTGTTGLFIRMGFQLP